ncbi:MAG: type 1 glutamine amidotransferase domain-containing protein [Candidatus Njordarchaeota archaeon]
MKKILIIAGQEFEDIELLYPLYRLREEGFTVHIASYVKEIIGKHGYKIKCDLLLREVKPEEYVALIIPGGRGPERIRVHAINESNKIIKHFAKNNKPIIAICHGPQLLISANVIRGRKLTSYPSIRDDLLAAGAEWIDSEVVVDKNIVTARIPNDIPSWFKKAIELIKKESHQ